MVNHRPIQVQRRVSKKKRKTIHAKAKGKRASQKSLVIDEIGVLIGARALSNYIQADSCGIVKKQRQQKLKLAKEAAAASGSNNGVEEALVQSQIAFDNEQNYFKTDLTNSNFLAPRTFLQPTTIAHEEQHQPLVKPAFAPQQTSGFAGGRRVTPSKETFDIDGFTLESFDDEMSMTRQKEAETRINLEGGTQGQLQSTTNYKQGHPSFDSIPMYDYTLSDATQNYSGITNGYNQYVSNPNNAQQNVRKLPKIIDLESLDETYEENRKKRKAKLKKIVSRKEPFTQ